MRRSIPDNDENRFHEIIIFLDGNNGIISLELNGIPAAQLPRASLVASFVADISLLSPISVTMIGNSPLSGFSSIASGCIRQMAVNDEYFDLSSNLIRCPIDNPAECSHEHFCPQASESCIKTAACNNDITEQLLRRQATKEGRNETQFISSRRIYFHGFQELIRIVLKLSSLV